MESLESLLDTGWAYHDLESERLARELEAASEQGAAEAVLAPFLHLSNHTIGEHLGDRARAFALARRSLRGRTPTAQTAKAWGRLYVAATLAGDAVEAAVAELACLKWAEAEFDSVLLDMRFMLCAALVGSKRIGDAARLYRDGIDLAGRIPSSASLDRTIAVASNNLAWELYETPARWDAEESLMALAAQTSLKHWARCGDWIDVELGHYLNAEVANAVGDPALGGAHAEAALTIIAANGDRPLDVALLQLARAEALRALGDAQAVRLRSACGRSGVEADRNGIARAVQVRARPDRGQPRRPQGSS